MNKIEIRPSDFKLPPFPPKFEYSEEPDSSERITIKFITIDSHPFTKNFPKNYTVFKVKCILSELFKLPTSAIELQIDDEPVKDTTRLEKLLFDEKYPFLSMRCISILPDWSIDVEKIYENLTVPDIITVKVQTDEGIKDVVVEIENQAISKPQLGGYRNVITGLHYYHTYTQTGPPKPKVDPSMKNHRDTQTCFFRNRTVQQNYEHSTQMTSTDIWIPTINDKILSPRPYETAEERARRIDIDGKVRTIQRYFRAWVLRKRIKAMKDDYEKMRALQIESEEREQREDEERKRKDIVRMVYPLTRSDFCMLYAMVERWKRAEIQRIDQHYCGPAKIAEFALLLDKEVQLLQSIEKIKQKVRNDIEIKKIVQFFKSIGQPIEWYSEYKSLHISMDTLEAQKGRQFFAIYNSITDKTVPKEEKLKRLVELKGFLSEHTCNEKKILINLIDRATEYVVRNLDDSTLMKRIEKNLLFHFQLPCNLGVTNHLKKLKVHNIENNLLVCNRCHRLKVAEEFNLDSCAAKRIICRSCKWVNKVDDPWFDVSPYRWILKQVRNYERQHGAVSSIAFIMQPKDIYVLIKKIWHSHSALSECRDIYELRLPRWKVTEDWSPWNCILLTKEEAFYHLKIEDLKEIYQQEFINYVFNKHALAKKYFHCMIEFDKRLHEDTKDNALFSEEFWQKKKNSEECLQFEEEA